jgi:hypothetical protein
MIRHNLAKWMRCLYLDQLWYNSNYHTAILVTPFKALYVYDTPLISLGSEPSSRVEAVNEML